MSLRYSNYKVQTLGFRRSLLILSHSFPFVKNFFQVFSNFFEPIRFSCLLSPRGDLSILTHRFSFVKNFFQILLNFFTVCSFSPPLADSLLYVTTAKPVCQVFSDEFSHIILCNPTILKREPPERLPCYYLSVTPHHRSDHKRHRFSYRPRQSCRRCPHPGRRRNYDPADSSAEQPLPGSWA